MRRDPFTLRQANHVFYEEREREAGAAGSDASASAVGACTSALSPTYLLPLSCSPSAAQGANGLNASACSACNSSAHNADAPQLGAEGQDGMRMREAEVEADGGLVCRVYVLGSRQEFLQRGAGVMEVEVEECAVPEFAAVTLTAAAALRSATSLDDAAALEPAAPPAAFAAAGVLTYADVC